jgi:hypothetical protein
VGKPSPLLPSSIFFSFVMGIVGHVPHGQSTMSIVFLENNGEHVEKLMRTSELDGNTVRTAKIQHPPPCPKKEKKTRGPLNACHLPLLAARYYFAYMCTLPF